MFLSARLRTAQHAGDAAAELTLTRLLCALWSRLPELEAAMDSGVSHPVDLYVRLAGLAGALCGVDPAAGIPPLRPYSHVDALACFEHSTHIIMGLLSRVRQDYRLFDFMHDASGFSLVPPAEALRENIYIALRMPSTADEQSAVRWMAEAVIAADSQHQNLLRQRMLGIPRRALDRKEAAAFALGEGVTVFVLSIDTALTRPQEALRIASPPGADSAHLEPWQITLLVPEVVNTELKAGDKR